MKKNVVIIILGLLVLLAISAFIAIRYSPNILITAPAKNIAGGTQGTSSNIILFYGNGCPHCANVEKYLSDNQVAAKINFTQKEVFSNQTNTALLGDKAHSCGLNATSVGVPFLWDGSTGKCIEGDQPVIDYFSAKLKQ